ncbi:type II secretion system protein GspI [Alcaligenes faecalis]|uniref:type II secretion system minor pseudopilin GspI n=1 Tax=Alcaligenes faecalis TaxID=511 RepID=UPI0012938FE5|nr:type II secretion system protein GspI [Alcaligenes faecalis]
MTERGMSLIEVLIALAIVSVALTAGLRALGLSASGSQAMHERSLALLAVDGVVAEMRLRRLFPEPGETVVACRQGSLNLQCKQTVQATANRFFRQVTVQASLPKGPVLAELHATLASLP